VGQVCAVQAQGAFFFDQRDPGAAAQNFAAFAASGFVGRDKYFQFGWMIRCHHYLLLRYSQITEECSQGAILPLFFISD
jgi:hypothetical protein